MSRALLVLVLTLPACLPTDTASPAGDPTPTGSPDAASPRVPVRASAPEGFEWTPRIYRGEAYSFFGYSIAGGDTDGVGAPDLVVGGLGKTYLIPGSMYPEVGSIDSVWTYPASGTQSGSMGHSIAIVRDITGDGKADTVVGDPLFKSTPEGPEQGRVSIFRGANGELWDSRIAHVFTRRTLNALSFAAGRFYDSDSVLFIGIPEPAGTGTVLATRVLGSDSVTTSELTGTSPGFGTAIAVGDFNCDGQDELWVTDPDLGANDNGAVMATVDPTGSPEVTWVVAGQRGDHLGSALAMADLDQDGCDDLVIGSELGGAPLRAGMVRVVFGTSLDATDRNRSINDVVEGFSVSGPVEGAYLGRSIAAGGNVDGDLYPDILAGAPRVRGSIGGAMLMLGADIKAWRDGTDRSSIPAVTAISSGYEAEAYFGWSVAFVGDQDGDGNDEFAISAPWEQPRPGGSGTNMGAVYVYGIADADGDGQSAWTDCDDSDPTIRPGAQEVCDAGNIDEDCDGASDDDDDTTSPERKVDWYADNDADGFGAMPGQRRCDAPDDGGRWISRGGDCDDTTATTNPDAQDTCNEVDDDCDGSVDGGLTAQTWYEDVDGDGFGTERSVRYTCDGSQPEGHAAALDDCDDARANVYPGAVEYCEDDLDSDCDGDPEASCETFQAWDTYLGCATAPGHGSGLGLIGAGLLGLAALRRRRDTSRDCDEQA